MRVYEELFIVKPDAPEEEVDAFVHQIEGVITKGNGTVDKTDRWGVRKLAYRVAKYGEGNYTLIQFTSTPELVHEVERRMRVSDLVIKFITVRIDEKQKKIAKRKKAREKRAARKPAPAPMAAAPVIPGEAPHAVPGVPTIPAAPVPAAPAAPEAPAAEATETKE
jgi:small subunit ribosomal protein S6